MNVPRVPDTMMGSTLRLTGEVGVIGPVADEETEVAM